MSDYFELTNQLTNQWITAMRHIKEALPTLDIDCPEWNAVEAVPMRGGVDAGAALVDDPRVALISATGSTRMGREVAPKVAARFARSILELGGNNAMVVMPSADLEQAATVAVKARMAEQQSASGLIDQINAVQDALKASFPDVRWVFFEPDDKG